MSQCLPRVATAVLLAVLLSACSDDDPSASTASESSSIVAESSSGAAAASSSETSDSAAETTADAAVVSTTETADASTGDTTTEDATETGTTDVPAEECRPKVDLVLSLDVSGDMGPPLQRLASDLFAVDNRLRAELDVDPRWHAVAWADGILVTDLTLGGDGPQTAQYFVDYWASVAYTDTQPLMGTSNDEPEDAGLDALALIAAWGEAEKPGAGEWRAGARRVVVHVTDSPMAEAPAVLSGYEMHATYYATSAALAAAGVAVLAWAPDNVPGLSAPWSGGQAALPDATGGGWLDLADELNAESPQFDVDIVEFMTAALEGGDCSM